jgi:hypothetical protein
MAAEKVRLRIGNLAKAVLVTGQAYQDPKDAFNEFVSNAADEYIQSDLRGERIRVIVRRHGKTPFIAIEDVGRGMSPDRLRELARNLFESKKSGDDRTLGEKAIGMLAYQQLGGRCDIVSCEVGSSETWALKLSRGSANAELERERRRARVLPGTTVYLYDLEPDVLRLFTQRKVLEYLRNRRGAAIGRGDYSIEVVEGRSGELVSPERPDGVKLNVPARSTLWGRVEYSLYVAPPDGQRRRVAVIGRAGTTIIDDMCELEEFDEFPWNSDRVAGQIVFESLQQSAGRRAVLRDRDVFPVFLEAVRSIAPAVGVAIGKVAREVDDATNERVADAIRRVFGRVLKELQDLDNPMRATVIEFGADGELPLQMVDLLPPPSAAGPAVDMDPPVAPPPERYPEPDDPYRVNANGPHQQSSGDRPPASEAELPVLDGDRSQAPAPGSALPPPVPKPRQTHLPTVDVDPEPGPARSRFDQSEGVVLYNDRHPDFLLVKDDESALLDYLATLVAKEYVLFNNPRAQPEQFAEEMVRMLVRVRRHLPTRKAKRKP